MIVPEETELTAPYWAGAARGQVMLQRCLECGVVWHPPAPTCPNGAADVGGPVHPIEWFAASGLGQLYSYTRVEHAAHPGVAAAVPYLVALVELEEGPRLICNLLDASPEGLVAGLRVSLSIGPAAGGRMLPVARLDRATPADAWGA
jgi:uncharacterized protein